MKPTPVERFWSKVKIAGPWDCWEWQGYKQKWGHGSVWWEGKTWHAHRVSYLISRGIIDPKLHVLHLCHNGSCVNPCHLYQGTHLQNMADRKSEGHYPTGDDSPSRKHPERMKRGSEIPWAKLNEWQAIGVMARYLQGASVAEIGREFNVTPQAVGLIVKGRNWRHLFAPEQ